MGDMTLCNYCSVRRMKRRHPNLILRPSENGWTEAYDPDSGEVCGWFMAVGDRCEC